MNVRHPMGVLHSFSIKNIFDDKMDLRLFYFDVAIYHTNLTVFRSYYQTQIHLGKVNIRLWILYVDNVLNLTTTQIPNIALMELMVSLITYILVSNSCAACSVLMNHLSIGLTPGNIYLFKVNNRNTRKVVK